MHSKLTLRLGEDLIAQAKKEARNTGRSLSKMVGDYFRSVTGRRTTFRTPDAGHALGGIVKRKLGRTPDRPQRLPSAPRTQISLKVLFDTNVVWDVLMDRRPFSKTAVDLFTRIETGHLTGALWRDDPDHNPLFVRQSGWTAQGCRADPIAPQTF